MRWFDIRCIKLSHKIFSSLIPLFILNREIPFKCRLLILNTYLQRSSASRSRTSFILQIWRRIAPCHRRESLHLACSPQTSCLSRENEPLACYSLIHCVNIQRDRRHMQGKERIRNVTLHLVKQAQDLNDRNMR